MHNFDETVLQNWWPRALLLFQVEFVGEQGSDTFGMTREFFTYVGHAMSTRYLTRTDCVAYNS